MPCLPEGHHADDQSSQASRTELTRYTAIVRIRVAGRSCTVRAETFAQRSAAVSWAKTPRSGLGESFGAHARSTAHRRSPSSSAGTSRRSRHISKWQRSKQAHLEFLERHALGKCNALT